MVDIHKVIGKLPFKPKKAFVLPKHRFTTFNPLHLQLYSNDNPLPGNEPYNAVDSISMHHNICYRDDDTPAGKRECNPKMLAELNAFVPEGRREKVDRQLVRSIIGLKQRMGQGIHWTNNLANELHKPVRRRRTVFAKHVDDIWAADLVDMSSFSRWNKGYKYLLTVIDVFSKYGWMVSLKTKTGKEVAQAFRKLFRNGHPWRLWTDKGTEFYNKQLKPVLTANNVMLYSTENEEKSSVVERWNRTMKNIMCTANNTQKYIDVLPSMVEKYNNTYHWSIKLTPSDARNPARYQHAYNALYAKVNAPKATSPKFHVADKVLITRKKGTFEKGFTPNWSEEVFTISTLCKSN